MGLIGFSSANGSSADYSGSNASNTASWSHSGVSGKNGLAVVSAFMVTAGGASNSVTATYGGVSMTLQGVQLGGSGDALRLAMFTLLNPPTGTQTVSVTWSGLSFTFPGKPISGAAMTYSNVGSVSGYTSAGGYGTTASVSVNRMVANEFTVFAHGRQTATAFSSFTGATQRHTDATSTSARIVTGDSTGESATVTSTATMSASDYYCSHGIVVRRFAEGDFFG